MESKVNYTVVGIFVIVLTTAFIMIVLWLSFFGHSKNYKTYLVMVREDVTGLSLEGPVRFNGVQVGYVNAIRLDAKNSRLVELELRIDSSVKITTSTYAILNAQGITGVIYVNLKASTEEAPLLVTLPGNPHPIIPSKPSFLMQLSEVLPEITKDIQRLSSNIAQVMSEKNRQAISASLQHISDFTKTLAENSENLTETLHLLHDTLSHAFIASKDMPKVMQKLNQTLSNVNILSLQATKTADSITETMQTSNIVLRNFSTQLVPNAQEALSSLNTATINVNHFIDELQRNPSMLVRGRGPIAPGPGEINK